MCKKKKIRPTYRKPLSFPETPICKACADDPEIYAKFQNLYYDHERSDKLPTELWFLDDSDLR
jgi:hypothetical protein